ncbi:MAG: tyrosine-type recombinase/integrase [Deltaproteobacteria bacterium]|nr:tyrosine-type recombinase/integrase [Deltaproteobacteria bacterium]
MFAVGAAHTTILRHTFISNLLHSSLDLRYTMDKAGHKRLATTTRYLHVIESKESPLKKMRFGGS